MMFVWSRVLSGIALLVRTYVLYRIHIDNNYLPIRVHWSIYPVGYAGRNFPGDAAEKLLGVLLVSSIGICCVSFITPIF
jgi:hypothetical protein